MRYHRAGVGGGAPRPVTAASEEIFASAAVRCGTGK